MPNIASALDPLPEGEGDREAVERDYPRATSTMWRMTAFTRVDSKHADFLRDEPRIAHGVVFRLIASFMDFSIDFHAKADLVAVEIEEIFARAMLVAEFQTARALLEFAPKQDFRQCHGSPELLGTRFRAFRAG